MNEKRMAHASEKNETRDFSLKDGVDKIAKVIPPPPERFQYTLTKDGVQKEEILSVSKDATLAETSNKLQVSAPQVAWLLREIESGRIKTMLLLHLGE